MSIVERAFNTALATQVAFINDESVGEDGLTRRRFTGSAELIVISEHSQ
jgi:hypothetical protein